LLSIFVNMPGCSKCRHADNGCGRCRPKRFTLRALCKGKQKLASELAQMFQQWLIKSEELTAGTSRDYAWAMKAVVEKGGRTSWRLMSSKLRNSIKTCQAKIETFMRLPQARVKKASLKKGCRRCLPPQKGRSLSKKSTSPVKRAKLGRAEPPASGEQRSCKRCKRWRAGVLNVQQYASNGLGLLPKPVLPGTVTSKLAGFSWQAKLPDAWEECHEDSVSPDDSISQVGSCASSCPSPSKREARCFLRSAQFRDAMDIKGECWIPAHRVQKHARLISAGGDIVTVMGAIHHALELRRVTSLRTRSGATLEVTGDHRMLVEVNFQQQERPAEQLMVGDMVQVTVSAASSYSSIRIEQLAEVSTSDMLVEVVELVFMPDLPVASWNTQPPHAIIATKGAFCGQPSDVQAGGSVRALSWTG